MTTEFVTVQDIKSYLRSALRETGGRCLASAIELVDEEYDINLCSGYLYPDEDEEESGMFAKDIVADVWEDWVQEYPNGVPPREIY